MAHQESAQCGEDIAEQLGIVADGEVPVDAEEPVQGVVEDRHHRALAKGIAGDHGMNGPIREARRGLRRLPEETAPEAGVAIGSRGAGRANEAIM